MVGTEATGKNRFTGELLAPIEEDYSHVVLLALLALGLFVAMALSCLFGYTCGRCQAKTEVVYVDKPIYIEAPAPARAEEDQPAAQPAPGLRERKAEVRNDVRRNDQGFPEELFVTNYGECYHSFKACHGLDSAATGSIRAKRPCYYCAGGAGGRKK